MLCLTLHNYERAMPSDDEGRMDDQAQGMELPWGPAKCNNMHYLNDFCREALLLAICARVILFLSAGEHQRSSDRRFLREH